MDYQTHAKVALGERLKALRGGTVLRVAAERARISVSYLSDLENGRAWPSLTTLIALADAYETTVVRILAPVDLGELAHGAVIPFDEL